LTSRHDLDALLLEVLQKLPPLPHRVFIEWVDLDAVDPKAFDEKKDWAAIEGRKDGMFIGLHPLLKRAPKHVVKYLIFHELLHLLIPPDATGAHPRAFNVAECLWPGYVKACTWLDGLPGRRMR